jgi:hypothetical protein
VSEPQVDIAANDTEVSRRVIDPVTPAEQLLYCAVRIEGRSEQSGWTGTGFIVTVDVGENKNSPILVTNRHVVEGATSLTFRLHRAADEHGERPSGKFDLCEVGKGDIFFPDDDSIDLAGIPIAGLFEQLKAKGTPAFYRAVGTDAFPSGEEWQDFDVLEDCIMVGCPNGLYDSTNNFAIFRKGCTASSLAVDYEGREEFLIDIACFGGSSGSPIFTYNPAIKFSREKKQFELGGRGLRFVGVLYAGPTYMHEGKVIMRTPVVNLRTTMHLGFAIKSTQVRGLIDKILRHFGLVEQASKAA